MGLFGLFGSKTRKKPLVMHVDDDEHILDMTRAILEAMNMEVISVADSAEGVKIAQKELPDLVLLDVRMPKITGFDVCFALKQDPRTKHIPVLMATAMGQTKDVEQAFSNGADDYIVKPLDIAKFREKIYKLLKSAPPSAA